MDEKTMVNDILSGVKSDLTAYQTAITEAENMNLRQTLQQIRNNDESFQYELFQDCSRCVACFYKVSYSVTINGELKGYTDNKK